MYASDDLPPSAGDAMVNASLHICEALLRRMTHFSPLVGDTALLIVPGFALLAGACSARALWTDEGLEGGKQVSSNGLAVALRSAWGLVLWWKYSTAQGGSER